MSKRLGVDVMQFVDILPGETRRYDHDGCTAGEDTKQRLYVTRAAHDADTLLMYCHNCQQGSRYKGKAVTYRDTVPSTPRVEVTEATKGIVLPDAGTPIGEFHAPSAAWLQRTFRLTGMGDGLCELYDIREYSNGSTKPRVWLPCYEAMLPEGNRNLWGYQLRRVDARDTGPKYYTKNLQRPLHGARVTHMQLNQSPVTVLVEDYMSGIAIDSAGYNVVVNWGVQAPRNILPQLQQGTKALIVWLDNDSEHVENQACEIARVQRLYKNNDLRISAELMMHDPKLLTPDHIHATVKEHTKGIVNG